MEYINVVFVDLPKDVQGLTTPNEDCSWTIAINAQLSYEKRKSALLHELSHIFGRDFQSDSEAGLIEHERHCGDCKESFNDHVIHYFND